MLAQIIPPLPVELVEEIIATAWHMPLSSTDRITFMRSSMLVSSTWADTFDRVSSRDVYIPSSAFCDRFLQRLREPAPSAASPAPSSLFARFFRGFKPPSKPSIQRRSANLACQSLTIQIANVDVHPDKHNRTRLPMGAVLDELLENLDARSLAPNLRHLTIEYLDAGFDDIFHRVGLAALPSQITHLDVRYSFSAEMPAWLAKALQDKQGKKRNLGWELQFITDLSVVGAGASTVSDMLRACPNAQIFNGEMRPPEVYSV
ncbi:hypothetical protein DFH09DRAFT_1133967 [Mycena vulgaris]|nr:hypothetical protein DFH09DRAFT_1133967 [Mycena vulgaris]